ncbi:TetR/AcrR family transcriptional regulator [Cesiribacter sp. SM1]|uniref:TetR/AcrR family transcriptional regulator n=1 Tax=Cesiribacter sp. SM1 TaxID=2861196 RepID=UPI001CD50A0F|nr:TetR family transcriptional regulator [Cesiribacter sp. SM1]
MKRTRSEAEETRNRLLQAGLSVFLERGFDRTSLEEIAQRVDMTRGAVYWHFKDKLALFEELVEKRLKPTQEQLEKLLKDEEIPPLQKITSFLKQALHLLAEDEEYRLSQQLLNKSCNALPELVSHYSLWQEKYLLALEQLYWQAQADRAVMAHISPRYLATYTLSVVNGICQHLLESDETVAEKRRMADQVVFLFMRSLQ